MDPTGLAAGSTSVPKAQPALSAEDITWLQHLKGLERGRTLAHNALLTLINISHQLSEQRCLLKPAQQALKMDDRSISE